jgi:hypothetical protein
MAIYTTFPFVSPVMQAHKRERERERERERDREREKLCSRTTPLPRLEH